jgi:hypothetical protein
MSELRFVEMVRAEQMTKWKKSEAAAAAAAAAATVEDDE